MAKICKKVSFKNATIDFDDRTITEVTKDDSKIYKLDDILKDWDKIEGVSLSIGSDDELPCVDDE